MPLDLSLPAGLAVAAVALGGLLGAILPTCLYVYVEPRGRRLWAVDGDTLSSRRAPILVRATSWLGFAVAQLAVPLLAVPVLCGSLLYAQIRLGALSPVTLTITAVLGLAALTQAVLAAGLVPLGVRLLARNAEACRLAAARARRQAGVNGAILAAGLALGWAMTAMPGMVRPIVRTALEWTALRPVMVYAALCLLHALMLGRCGRVVADK